MGRGGVVLGRRLGAAFRHGLRMSASVSTLHTDTLEIQVPFASLCQHPMTRNSPGAYLRSVDDLTSHDSRDMQQQLEVRYTRGQYSVRLSQKRPPEVPFPLSRASRQAKSLLQEGVCSVHR